MNQTNHEKWMELADIYAVGALDGAELLEFENHLTSGCELCQSHLIQTDGILGNLAASYSLMTPPVALKKQIMNQLASPALVPKPGISWAFAGIGTCALASLIVILGWNLSQTRKEMHALGMLMTMPGARVMEMKGMEPSLKATGRVIRHPESNQCFFMAMGLSSIPEGKVYELWGLKAGEPVPMGTFKVDKHGCAMLNLSSFQKLALFDQFAVTLEPSGGVPKPTGPMHLIATI